MKFNLLLKRLLLAFLTIGIYSCNPGSIDCPGLESQYSAWLPYKSNDVITYTNDSGQEIQFAVNLHEISIPKTLECGPDGLGGSKCPNCLEPTSVVSAETQDTSRRVGKVIYQSLYTRVIKPDNKNDSVYLSYQILDHGNLVAIGPTFRKNINDSILSSFRVGGRIYSNVIVHQVDTTVNPYPNPIYKLYFIWKSYYNKEFGVIAFHDLKTHTFFYRKP